MSQAVIKALQYEVEDVGKRIKQTKKRYLWVLQISSRIYNIVLDTSLMSGKIKLSINGKIFHEVEQNSQSNAYQHSFIVDKCVFDILEQGDAFQLRVNKKNFMNMLIQQKSVQEFKQDEVHENDFEIEKKLLGEKVEGSSGNNGKKIVLNIPGISCNGMKKKKQGQVQSENWNQMLGSDSAFPNYFGPTSIQKQSLPNTCPQKTLIDSPPSLQINQKPQQSAEFNTIQDLFKTISNSGEYVQKQKVGEASVYTIDEIPSIGQINLNQFNTMQNMFLTCHIQEIKANVESNLESKENSDILEGTATFAQNTNMNVDSNNSNSLNNNINLNDFNTMQNMFSTMKFDPTIFPSLQPPMISEPTNPSAQNNTHISHLQGSTFQPFATNSNSVMNVSSINVNDFNTMQNMFTTNNFAPSLSNFAPTLSNLTPTLNSFPAFEEIHSQSKTSSSVTNTPSEVSIKPTNSDTIQKINEKNIDQNNFNLHQININDFNTMQNMFATNTFQQILQPPSHFQTNTKSLGINLQKKEEGSNQLKNININDFNTMQNMFKTGAYLPSNSDKKQNLAGFDWKI